MYILQIATLKNKILCGRNHSSIANLASYYVLPLVKLLGIGLGDETELPEISACSTH